MKNSEFLDRLEPLNEEDKKVLEQELGKENLSSVKRFGEALKKKLQEFGSRPKKALIKALGVLFISTLIITGASGCTDTPVNETPKTSTNEKGPEETSSILSSYITTEKNPEDSTPETTVDSTPVTSTDKNPITSENPPVTSTPTTSETPPITTTPDTTLTPPITTTPETSEKDPEVDTPVIDIPGDEDGYTYPKFFADLVHKDIVLNSAISGAVKEHHEVYSDMPEIVFVQMGTASIECPRPIEIYSKFNLDNGKELYTRFTYNIANADYKLLKMRVKYSNYDQYVEAIVTALQNQDKLFSATYSEENDLTMTEEESAALAPIIDEKFVDVDVLYTEIYNDSNYNYFRNLSGFGYDAEGNAYSFNTDWELVFGFGDWENTLNGAVSGELKSSDFNYKETTSKRIDSVFVSSIENQSE